MNILLTNDDGIDAIGLHTLYRGLVDCGHQVTLIAPKSHQSAVSAHITLYSPLTLEHVKTDGLEGYSLTGTPADCVLFGLWKFFKTQKPDLVVSGINSGHNVGIENLYSGTMNAAHQGTSFGIPSIAVSRWHRDGTYCEEIGRMATKIITALNLPTLAKKLPQTTFNLNFPELPVKELKGIKASAISRRPWPIDFIQDDERTFNYANIPFNRPTDDLSPGTETADLNSGYVTVTTLTLPAQPLTGSMKLTENDIQAANQAILEGLS